MSMQMAGLLLLRQHLPGKKASPPMNPAGMLLRGNVNLVRLPHTVV